MFRLLSRSGNGRRSLWLWVATAAVLLAGAAPTHAAPFAYVTNQNDNTVSQYAIGAGGGLSPLTPPTAATGSGPFGVAVTPDGKSAYIANFGGSVEGGSISQYDVDPVSGGLSPKTPATVATDATPFGFSVAVAPDGKSAYVINTDFQSLNPTTVSQYDIDPASGGLSPKSPPTVATPPAPFSVAVTPDGESVYVVNAGGTVSQYDVDPVSGALSPKTPATVATDEGPVGVAVTPDGTSAYIANNGGNTVSQYDVAPSGALSPKAPSTVVAGFNPIGLAITADGKTAYATDNGAEAVSQYSIDQLTGTLSPKTPATVAAGSGPFGIAVTPTPRMPTTKAQCKHGGWKQFGFKNQGQCIRFVKHGANK